MAMLSSPLAAMQPPPPRWAADIRSQPPPVPSFNFAELGMRRQSSDYFGLSKAAVRGSSPSASLAADLSQNFYIDQRYVPFLFFTPIAFLRPMQPASSHSQEMSLPDWFWSFQQQYER
jgi:hypothetical protein